MSFHSTRRNIGLRRRSCGAALAAWFLLGLAGSLNAQDEQYAYDLSGNFVLRTATTNGPPQILGQPQTQIVVPGGLGSFSVVMADPHGLSYQWRFNTNNIDGAVNDALLVANVRAANEGPYSVVIANSSGSVTSAPAMLLLDSDEDGLPDSWELTYFGNLTSQRGLGDPDGDGISNFDEFRRATNPTNSASFSPLLTVTKTGTGFGAVTIVPAKASYDLGDSVTLTATPVPPSLFGGWAGSLNTSSNPVTLTMNSNRMMQARFSTAVPAPPGMIAYWRAQTDASDSIGTNHGAFYNGTSVVGPSITSTGKVGSAFNFDGTNYVCVPDSATLRPAQFTAEAWVYPTAQFPLEFLTVISRRSANSFAQWVLNIYNGKVYFNSSGGPLPIPLDQWTHLAISFDGSTQRLYFNGALAASQGGLTALQYDLQGNPPLYIGADIGGGRRFNGRIDEVTLYNRVLTDSEIAGLYNADVAGRMLDRPAFTSPPQLPQANLGIGYTQQVTAALGMSPISFTLSGGAVPPGMTLSPDGVISGIPGLAGYFGFFVRATDAAAVSTEQQVTLAVFDQVTAPAGLVAWWRGETNALDSAGANHGALSNGVTFVPGFVGQAFAFSGASQFVEISDAPALRPVSFTLETWVRLNSVDYYPILFSKRVGSQAAESYLLFSNPPGLLSGRYGDTAGSGGQIAGGTLTTGIWYHVAYTFDDSSKQHSLYLDGTQVASGTGTKSIGYDAQPLHLGRDTDYVGISSFLNGSLDEPAIYNRALSGAEIASIYNAGVLGKGPPLPMIILRASVEAGVVLISFDASIGRGYEVEAASALSTDAWSGLTNITAISEKVLFSVPITGSSQRFYRVKTAGN